MRRTHPVGSRRIRPRLDRLEPILALGVGVLDGEALEVRIQRRWVRVTRVAVAALGVGLPELDPRPSDRLPLDAQDPSHHMDHLSRRSEERRVGKARRWGYTPWA